MNFRREASFSGGRDKRKLDSRAQRYLGKSQQQGLTPEWITFCILAYSTGRVASHPRLLNQPRWSYARFEHWHPFLFVGWIIFRILMHWGLSVHCGEKPGSALYSFRWAFSPSLVTHSHSLPCGRVTFTTFPAHDLALAYRNACMYILQEGGVDRTLILNCRVVFLDPPLPVTNAPPPMVCWSRP